MTNGLAVDIWHNCYDQGWKTLVVDEAFKHPAKVSFSLSDRIYAHLVGQGFIKPGDTVIDPFGGIAGFALHAAIRGIHWIGCELEQKFAEIGAANIDLWNYKYGASHGYVSPSIYCGDSRRLREVLNGTPTRYVRDKQSSGRGLFSLDFRGSETYGGDTPGQLGRLRDGDFDAVISSPPYASGTVHDGNGIDQSKLTGNKAGKNSQAKAQGYGDSVGQLSTLPTGDAAAVISSPPYAGSDQNYEQGWSTIDPSKQDRDRRGLQGGASYGKSEGQLGAMSEGDAGAVIGSPPFEAGAEGTVRRDKFKDPEAFAAGMSERSGSNNNHYQTPEARKRQMEKMNSAIYGDTEGNIGNSTGETFWTASRTIVEECFAILRHGGVAVWVLKDFVRDKKRVPFSDQWLALCLAVGFELECRHHASLVKRGRKQKLLDGGEHEPIKERKSFFRRLAEKNGAPRIDHEDVICVRKPFGASGDRRPETQPQ